MDTDRVCISTRVKLAVMSIDPRLGMGAPRIEITCANVKGHSLIRVRTRIVIRAKVDLGEEGREGREGARVNLGERHTPARLGLGSWLLLGS